MRCRIHHNVLLPVCHYTSRFLCVQALQSAQEVDFLRLGDTIAPLDTSPPDSLEAANAADNGAWTSMPLVAAIFAAYDAGGHAADLGHSLLERAVELCPEAALLAIASAPQPASSSCASEVALFALWRATQRTILFPSLVNALFC